MIDIEDKVCVITGAGKIGLQLALELKKEGAVVVVGDNDKELIKEYNKKYIKEKIEFRYLDISYGTSVIDFIVYLTKVFGKVDAWINTAFPKHPWWGKENLCERGMFDWNMSRHLFGYYDTSFKIANLMMKDQGFGSVINFGSIYGVNAPDFSIYEGTNIKMPILYVMMKGAINMMSKYFAAYYGKCGIRFNVISPGGIFEHQNKIFVEKYEKKTALKRMAVEEDIVGIVIFLISDASSYITGQNIIVDGGWTT